MELNLYQNSDHGIQCKEFSILDNIIQHFIQCGEFSTPFSGENSALDSVGRIQHSIQWGELSTPFSGENSALGEGVCIWWTGKVEWNTGLEYWSDS